MNFLYSTSLQDLSWGEATDFTILNGDLEDTTTVKGKGFLQEVFERIMSSRGDWKLAAAKGASLEQFEGMPNIEDTWTLISERISAELKRDLFLLPSDFAVFVAPISREEIGIRIDFSQEIGYNLEGSNVQLNMIYNTANNRAFIVS